MQPLMHRAHVILGPAWQHVVLEGQAEGGRQWGAAEPNCATMVATMVAAIMATQCCWTELCCQLLQDNPKVDKAEFLEYCTRLRAGAMRGQRSAEIARTEQGLLLEETVGHPYCVLLHTIRLAVWLCCTLFHAAWAWAEGDETDFGSTPECFLAVLVCCPR